MGRVQWDSLSLIDTVDNGSFSFGLLVGLVSRNPLLVLADVPLAPSRMALTRLTHDKYTAMLLLLF